MFSTLLGALPADPSRPVAGGDEVAGRLDDVSALCATGLDLVSDGSAPADPDQPIETTIARWQAAAAASAVSAKAVLLGPFSSARATGGDSLEIADRLRATIVALAAAGCPLVEIAEPDALAIATDPAAAAAFAAAHRRLVDGTEGIHASLALTGGNHDGVPPDVLFDLAYASYAFDLIAGPDNWRLVVQAPGDRGIVCGALDLAPGADETRELLVWAAHYAASTSGRGLARVGLANAPVAPDAPPPARSDVLRKLSVVAEASRIAAVESGEEMASLLDPRAIDIRSAAMGRFAPYRRRGRTGR
jgi:hypothetical protein